MEQARGPVVGAVKAADEESVNGGARPGTSGGEVVELGGLNGGVAGGLGGRGDGLGRGGGEVGDHDCQRVVFLEIGCLKCVVFGMVALSVGFLELVALSVGFGIGWFECAVSGMVVFECVVFWNGRLQCGFRNGRL